ncbi:SIS domain-containing protein [Spongisporangium articulatum]|uniref:SIS domain-containing protein n=1 Tax=Spongisporangium articulatum TaxID=3362603 RepID=A0ABW8APW7_9ACTN
MLDEQLLDDESGLIAADPSGSLRALAGAGAQVRMAMQATAEAGINRIVADGRPRAVVVASLGGSAVVGDVLTLLAGAGAPVPVSVRRGMPLPGWVGPLDMVVAVSMSGRAPGPLGLAAEAARRGCRLLTVGQARSPLAEVAERTGGVHVPVPPAQNAAARASRMALWALAVPVVRVAFELGLTDASTQVLERVADRLDAQADLFRPSSEAFVNPAKSLALELSGSVPVVLGDGDVTGVAGARAVSMLARTARVPAMRGALPDDAGDVVATFDGPLAARPDDIFADPEFDDPVGTRLRLLLLRDAAPTPDRPDGSWLETSRTADAVKMTAEDAGVRVTEVSAEPGHPLERLAGLVALTDFAAVYMALAGGIDPLTSPHVADLRDRTH